MTHPAVPVACPPRSAEIRTKPPTRFPSQIMAGSVFHARCEGAKNSFRYETVMVLLNLDTLDTSELFKTRPYFSLDRPNLLAFHRADHFGDPNRPLKSTVLQLIQDECEMDAGEIETQVGTVYLLTTVRSMGYCFNPISIYYCMSFEDPCKCLYVVLEVTNTPWLERVCYVLRASECATFEETKLMDMRFVKEMHVSPFFKTENCEYRIRLNHTGTLMINPSAELQVVLELHECEKRTEKEPESEELRPLGKKLFTARLNLQSHDVVVQSIKQSKGSFEAGTYEFFIVCAMTIMAWQALLYIHWQAIKLALYGQPIIKAKHPAYRGKLRATVLYLGDLAKHLFVFAVAVVALGAIKALKCCAQSPIICVSTVAVGILFVCIVH